VQGGYQVTQNTARLPDFVEPMKAKLVGSVPVGAWIYEIKFDGYRALALINICQVPASNVERLSQFVVLPRPLQGKLQMRTIVRPRPKRPREILSVWGRAVLPVQSRLELTAVQLVGPGRCGRADSLQVSWNSRPELAAS
jgi:hypothetical protein